MLFLRNLASGLAFISMYPFVFQAKADDLLVSLTETLVSHVLAPDADTDTLISSANDRATILVEEALTNPHGVLDLSIPPPILSLFDDVVRPYVENFAALEGILMIVSLDNKDGSQMSQIALKPTDSPDMVFLHFDVPPTTLPIGRMVRVGGILLPRRDGDPDGSVRHMVIRSDAYPLEVLSETSVISAPSAVGRQRTGVFLARFAGDPGLGADTASGSGWVFAQLDSLLRRHSLGRTWLLQEEIGQTELAATKTCDMGVIEEQLSQALAQSGRDIAAYDRIFLILPSLECSWRTATTFPASPTLILVSEKPTTKRLLRALLHGLGMPGSQIPPCNFDTLHSECRSKIGDDLQQLSQIGAISLTPYHKESVNWMSVDDRIFTVERGGIYRIWTADAIGGKPRPLALKIERPAPLLQGRTTYYVEYRVRKLGGERLPPEVVIYIVSGNGVAETVNLTFAGPVQEELQEALSLTSGRFVDHAAGLQIEIRSASPWTADLDIWFDPRTCVRASPNIEVMPSETPYVSAGSEVDFSLVVSSRDSLDCGPMRPTVDLQVPNGWSVRQDSETFMLQPDETVQIDVAVTVPPDEGPGFRRLEWLVQEDATVAAHQSMMFVLPSAANDAAYVTHVNPVPDATLGVPSYNAANPLSAAYTDEQFGTRIVRVTGNEGDPILINGTTSSGEVWPRHTCHQYSSNDNAWNADGSLLLLHGCDNRFGILLNGNTFKVLRIGGLSGFRMWDRSDPTKMYVVGGNTVNEHFPLTNQSRTLMTLEGYSGLFMDGHGQNASDDGEWIAVTATRNGRKVMFGINLATRRKGPDIAAPSNLNEGVFISASGRYLIAGLGYGGKDQNIYDVATGALVNTYRGDITNKHPDTYQMNGRDYWIFVASGGGIGGRILRRDLLTNQEYTYVDVNNGVANHVSTRNIMDGRWAVATYDSSRNPFSFEIMAVRIDGNHRNVVRRLAHHNSYRYAYSNEPHPNPSPDGRKIVFASNWGTITGQSTPTSAYVILLPDWDTPGDE